MLSSLNLSGTRGFVKSNTGFLIEDPLKTDFDLAYEVLLTIMIALLETDVLAVSFYCGDIVWLRLILVISVRGECC